jgi:hypothetical protein
MFFARPALADDVEITEAARTHFNAGVNFMQDPSGAQYEEAYREFKAAYAASPSWKILGNLGICAMKLERDSEAISAFETYLKSGGDQVDPSERAQMEKDSQTLKAGLVTLKVATTPPGATIVDERTPVTGSAVVNRYDPAPNGALELGIHPGHHKITAQLEGYAPGIWEFDAAPGSSQDKTIELHVPPKETAGGGGGGQAGGNVALDHGSPSLRIASYAAFGVGVIGVGAGTLFSLQSKSKADQADEKCGGDRSSCQLPPTGPAANEVTKLNDDAGKAQKLSIVGFVVGGVGLAAGVTLLVLSSGSSSSAQANKPSVTAWMGYRSVGLSGRF